MEGRPSDNCVGGETAELNTDESGTFRMQRMQFRSERFECNEYNSLVNPVWPTGSPAQVSEPLTNLAEHPLVMPSTH